MKIKALETIQYHKMLEQGDRVCVALSGGADSVALLAFMREIAGDFHLHLSACHLNHNLRGEESARDERFVRELCAGWGIPLTVAQLQVAQLAAATGDSLELAGRHARYELFARLHAETGCKIATAHTLSDNVETVLHRLVRGTGIAGLGGIAPVRDYVIRPLLGCTRAEIEDYCAANHLAFVQDSSNFSPEFTRNKLRLEVVPKLYELNPALHSAVAQLTASMREAQDFLQGEAAALIAAHRGAKGLPCAVLLSAHPALRREVLAQLAGEAGIALSARHTALCQQLAATGGAVQLGGGVTFCAGDGYFTIGRRQPHTTQADFAFPLGSVEALFAAGGAEVALPVGKIAKIYPVKYEQMKNFSKQNVQGLKNVLCCAKINGNLTLRNRRAGDCIHLPARGVTKQLKKLMQEAEIPAERRGEVPVLADESGVLWVEGFGSDSRAAFPREPTPDEKFLIVTERTQGNE